MADSDDNEGILAPDSRRQRSLGTGAKIGAVLIVTAIAVWLVPGKETATETSPANAPGTDTARAQGSGQPSLIGAQSGNTGATNPSAPPKPGITPGKQARELISRLRAQSPPDPQQAFSAARNHQQSGELTDAYLLYFYAARLGHGPSAMVLGRASDPASFHTNGLVDEPDELQANKWYRVARDSGIDGAAEALDGLRQHIEQAAASGDERARRLMLQWN